MSNFLLPNFRVKPWFGLIIVFAFCLPQASQADNWSQWRGNKLDSVSKETSLPGKLTMDNNLLWKLEMPGTGGASPIVWNDHIFVTSVEGNGQENGKPLSLLCITTDGKVKWKKPLEGKNKRSRDSGDSASPSPFTDGEHVWAMTTNGVIQCFDFEGNQVWAKDLQKEYGEFHIQFGMTSTPVLDKGKIYLQLIHGKMKRGSKATSVGWVVALDSKSGKEVWKHKRKTDGMFENMHSYASPSIYRDDKREFLVTHGGDYVIGHSLDTGDEIFRCGDMNPKGDGYNYFLRFVSSPLCADGMLIVPTAKSGPVLALDPAKKLTGDVTEKKETRHWRLDQGTPDVASPVVYDGMVYLARETGVLITLDSQTGEVVYQKRMLADRHRSTPVAGDGKIYFTDRRGNLKILEAGSEPNIITNLSLGEETLASPAIANGVLYVRTQENLYAFGNSNSQE